MLSMVLVAAVGGLGGACPAADDEPPAHETMASTTNTVTDGEPTSGEPTSVGPTSSTPTDSDSDSGAEEPWLELGWGVTEFNPYDGVLPIVVGPQGLAMFSVPLRGAGFYNPPDPGFDNPDMPILQAWVDVEGHENGPGGHFNEVIDYPALFYPSLELPGALEGPAVWLVIPDDVEPEQLPGLAAHLHAHMVDANGLMLSDDHDLVIGEAPAPPKGP